MLTSAITPVPGGVGPMTIAMLLAQTVKKYKSKGVGHGTELNRHRVDEVCKLKI